MSLVSPDVIRSEQHVEIGNLITSSVGIILGRWASRAAVEQPHANRAHHEVLLDHLTELLQSLGQSLRAAEPAEASQHCLPAAQHGEQRWDAGWSLAEVVRDYQILRLVLLEFLEESLERPLRYREILAVGLALDEAISASVVVYTKGRDEHLAQSEKRRIEEIERAQQQLQAHAENLQRADRQKNEFLAILAHELRNPLAPVRHAVHVLRLKKIPDPELQWAGDVIERQAQQLARMIDDLSDISRVAHGKIRLEKATVALGTIMQRAVEDVQSSIEARSHRLKVTIPPDPIWLEADAQRLTQVLVNLLINAAKYTDDGGEICLIAERQGDEVLIRVRDTGIGIPVEHLQRIFEPFTQEQQTEDRVQGGLGIGLALVRDLVKLHDGRVEARSDGRGKGSEFIVYLRVLSTSPVAQTPAQPVSAKAAPARRILVVDDNHDAAHSLAMLLKLMGHEVQMAHDGPTALELVRTHPPEIVLLDIGMPRMNGLEVGRRIRQQENLAHVVLVAITGYGQDQDRQRSSDAGFDVHLVKPVELTHLHAVLRHSNNEVRQADVP